MKKILMIIAPKNFRDEELFETKKVLEQVAKVEIASTTTDKVTGMLGGTAKSDLLLADVNIEEYDAIVFVGGVGASMYFNNSTALRIAKTAFEKGKIVAAICIAPSILANAGILENGKATCYPSEASNLRAKGASYTGNSVEIDGNIVTANGPNAAKEFGKAIIKAMSA